MVENAGDCKLEWAHGSPLHPPSFRPLYTVSELAKEKLSAATRQGKKWLRRGRCHESPGVGVGRTFLQITVWGTVLGIDPSITHSILGLVEAESEMRNKGNSSGAVEVGIMGRGRVSWYL